MERERLYVDIAGKIENLSLGATNALLPLFEAISNAKDAIEESGNNDGIIIIEMLRDDTKLNDRTRASMPVKGFRVIDNGIGFNDDNFNSFQTSDSTKKAKKGGKGLGRFAYLKVFDTVNASSVYAYGTVRMQRKFDFVISQSGISGGDSAECSKDLPIGTEFIMQNPKKPYSDNIPAKAVTVAEKILEHFLALYVLQKAPVIIVTDGDDEISLSQLYADTYGKEAVPSFVVLDQNTFDINYIKMYKKSGYSHSIHLCAHDREVVSDPVSSYFPGIASPFSDADEREFFYQIYVSSEYLNKHVNAQRTNFNFGVDSKSIAGLYLSDNEIINAVIEDFKEKAKAYLEPIARRNREYVRNFVATKFPAYNHLLRNLPEETLEKAGIHMNDEQLEMFLYKEERLLEIKTKIEGVKLLKDLEDKPFSDELEKAVESYSSMISDIQKSNLTDYVIKRKAVIELLDKLIRKRQTEDSYALEEDIHKLIVPMRKHGGEIDFFDHNLWMIDDRLAYQRYLGSDKTLKSMMPEVNSNKEPDIISFDVPAAIGENDGYLNSITIVEFKRPMRALGEKENPYDQVMEYIDKINEKKAFTINGRPFENKNGLRFYVYIIMDILPRTEKLILKDEFKLLPDGASYYKYHSYLETHVEIIPYQRMVEMAKERNHAFFKKLGLE